MTRDALSPGEHRRHEELRLRFLLARISARDREALIDLHGLLSSRLSLLLLTLGLPSDRVADVLAEALLDIWHRPIAVGASRRALCGIAAVTYRHGIRALCAVTSRGNGSQGGADRLVESLPLAQRVVLGLVHGIGCSGDEVAHILQCPLASVVARMRQVRRALRTPPRPAVDARHCADLP